ncbi:MAG: hypothetical protein E7385_04960 [Ruminococcaceae bacterium]|nr:hypothetical protein [Oscillospiraceae bacterium]
MTWEYFYKEKNHPVSVVKYKRTQGADTLINKQGSMLVKRGGYVVFDMGAGSVGGYPVFSVSDYTGSPRVRISYSDRLRTYSNEDTMDRGDFDRGTCTYLGIELPVMPANPYRYEDYNIFRTGKFIYPLIQGQQRFVMLSVQDDHGTDCSVTFESFYILDAADKSSPVGYFKSDDEKLNRIWMASARTLRLATVQANQFELIEGKICLRKLTKHRGEAILCRPVCRITDIHRELITQKSVQVDCVFELSLNPQYESGISFLLFAQKKSEGTKLQSYRIDVIQSGLLALSLVHGDKIMLLAKTQVEQFKDNFPYELQIHGNEQGITVKINSNIVLKYTGKVDCSGCFGLSMEQEWRAIIDNITVASQNKIIYKLSDGLDAFDICKTDFFISDGAKRDRIPWSGDLDWAFNSGWYAFGKEMKARNTLDILGRHTNPEGYIYATCYPENNILPQRGEYGYYQSDMFAAWYVVSTLTYGYLAGENEISGYYSKLRGCLEYLWQYVDPEDGLFYQRYETSKGLWDHKLGDVGKNSYTNLIIYDAMKNFAEYATRIGRIDDAELFSERAEIMKRGIFTYLYNTEKKGFIKRKDWPELCDMANPYAMCKGLVSDKIAAQISSHAESITHGYGKIILLMLHGLYRYGYTDIAVKMLYGKNPLYTVDGCVCCNADWMSIVGSDEYPETVYECMHNPPMDFGFNNNWGDLCHPDSGVCGLISGHIAGILPAKDGFQGVFLQPSPGPLRHIECSVPVANGLAKVSIKVSDEGSLVELSLPYNIPVKTDFSRMVQPVKYKEIKNI